MKMFALPTASLLFVFSLACQSSRELSPEQLSAKKEKSQQTFALALQRSKEGKNDSAEALFREAIDLDAGTLERHLGLAGFLARTDRAKEAFAVYQAALQRFGDRPEIYEEIAFVRNEAGENEAAITALKKALDLRAKLPDTAENREWMKRDREGIRAIMGGG